MRRPKPPKVVEIVVLDTIGVILMIAAILTGWLPGPGGIPLFIIGLSLLAVNHEWAKKHIDRIQDYIVRLNNAVFVKDRRIQILYDVICSPLILIGGYLLWRHSSPWVISVGIFLVFGGLTMLLGNRDRLKRFRANLKRKH